MRGVLSEGDGHGGGSSRRDERPAFAGITGHMRGEAMRFGLIFGVGIFCAAPAAAGYIGFGCEATATGEGLADPSARYEFTYHEDWGVMSVAVLHQDGEISVEILDRARAANAPFGRLDETFILDGSGTLVLSEGEGGVVAHLIYRGDLQEFILPDCEL